MKFFVSFLSLCVIGALIFGLIFFKKSSFFQENQGGVFQNIKEFMAVKKHNLFFAQRQPPISFVEKEAKLSEFLPQVFGQFDSGEWRDFWALFYEPMEVEKGKYKVKKYRSKADIEEYLTMNYENPFSFFKPEHWAYFWEIVK